MKKYLLLFELIFASYAVVAQTNEKQKAEAPAQLEMQDMMNDVSEEDKKVMEEMGIKIPSFQNVPDASDQ